MCGSSTKRPALAKTTFEKHVFVCFFVWLCALCLYLSMFLRRLSICVSFQMDTYQICTTYAVNNIHIKSYKHKFIYTYTHISYIHMYGRPKWVKPKRHSNHHTPRQDSDRDLNAAILESKGSRSSSASDCPRLTGWWRSWGRLVTVNGYVNSYD